MNPEVIERVLKCDRLPSLPAVAMRVVELTQSNKSSVHELGAVITGDQGLSAKILKTVNSSFYGLGRPCTTINQAIVMLGLNAVKTLALGFSLVSNLKGRDKGTDFDYPAYWRRGLLSAVASKCIAAEAKIGHDEECFLAGLLQDIGMIAMYEALGQEYGYVMDRAGQDHRALVKAELAELETTHGDIGAMLAMRWKLPPELVNPIKFHERAAAAPGDYLEICQAVGLGNVAADVLCANEPALVLKKFYTKAEEWFHLKPAKADEIMAKISAGAKEVSKFLELDLAKFNDMTLVRQQAADSLLQMCVPFSQEAAVNGDAPAAVDVNPSNIDTTTMLPNKIVFSQNMVAAIEQFTVGGGPISVALLSVDEFAAFQSEQGNEYADQMLVATASLIRALLEPHHAICCAFERGTFAIMLGNCDRLTAAKHIERVKQAICANVMHIKPPGLLGVDITVTLSAGMATLDNTTREKFTDIDSVIETLSRALQSAAKAGRNVLRIYVPKNAAA
jgi:two-component system, cell cycle response regulator